MTHLHNEGNVPDLTQEELRLLLRLGERLVAELDLENVIDLVAETACQVVQAETLVVPLIDVDRQTFTYWAARGKYAAVILGQTFPIHEGACGWVLQHQRPLLFGEGSSFAMDRSVSWRPGMASSLLVPLISRGVIIGGLSALGREDGGPFVARDQMVLSLFANQASIAIDNARMFQKLGAEESRLRLVLDSAGEAIYGIDLAGCCTFANPSCVQMLGYSSEKELLGKSMHATIHHSWPDGRAFSVADCQIHRAQADYDGNHNDTEVYWRRDGTAFPVEYWAHPQLQDGYVVGAVVTFVDISERQRATQELALVNFAMNHVTEAAYLADREGRFHYVNDQACKMHGRSRDELLKLKVTDVDTLTTRPEQWAERWESLKVRKSATFESRHIGLHDGDYPVEISANYFEFFGEPYVLGLVRDITERKRSEAGMQLAASVFTFAREGITITDPAGNIVEANDAFARITGYSREETLGKNPRILKSGRQPTEYYQAMWQALVSKGYWTGEIWNRRKNGEVYAEMLTISAVRDAQGKTQNYVALFTDITPLKEHQQQLEHIAHYDALTSLPNRVLLADRMRQTMAQCQRRNRSLAVAYLDLDGFKPVNDRYGHEVGDELLIAIAQSMKEALREGDTLARLGGDEFVALLVDLESALDCEPVLARLLRAAAAPVTLGELRLQVSASIGVTLYPQDGADADQLLRHADQAMYQAKQGGKNRYHMFDVAQDAAVQTQRESLEHIRRALQRKEFVLYYQPKVNMKSGAVIGAEALIRWRHPERGLLLPAAFLPIIEDHPIAVELGEWVIQTALLQMSDWHRLGLDLSVSVNVGARQLQQNDFAERLATLLAAHPGLSPSRLELEILETSALEDVAKVSELMHACSKLGVGFALDDFGTGYSSLTYLKHLPAELLKIDQTFVRDMLGDTDDLAIVEAVVGLSKAFRRNVIAEGVESVAHGELLLLLGCDLGQGFGIARPMPAGEMPDWVAGWRPAAGWTALRQRVPTQTDLAVVFAEVEHRHWVAAIERFLRDELDTLPPLDQHKCRFSRWQQGEGALRYGEHAGFSALCAVHERVHRLGGELVGAHVRGETADRQSKLAELQALRDTLIAQLRGLVSDPVGA